MRALAIAQSRASAVAVRTTALVLVLNVFVLGDRFGDVATAPIHRWRDFGSANVRMLAAAAGSRGRSDVLSWRKTAGSASVLAQRPDRCWRRPPG
jgi:hypothetical protein